MWSNVVAEIGESRKITDLGCATNALSHALTEIQTRNAEVKFTTLTRSLIFKICFLALKGSNGGFASLQCCFKSFVYSLMPSFVNILSNYL